MQDMIPGQRWISNSESELGLGLIVNADFNRVTVYFKAAGERRIYARDNAPLTRVRFAVGDVIETEHCMRIMVQQLHELNGLITYAGADATGRLVELPEQQLNPHIQFNKPQDRLFTGQFDPSSWFQLRYATWRRLQQFQQSAVKGLQGARIALLAHQLYIAHETAKRAAPRVMLADEVGLGKTIEAGLIVHHRLLNGLSQRVLIMVPDSLVHQWLVEMLRRFNLRFSVFDEERCVESHADNPFMTEQLILCSQRFFSASPERQRHALEAEWDIVVVDEAHHLEWSATSPSADYLFVEQLAQAVPGLILLTATPEQLGKESHFARLRLLDPNRFYSFERFLQEEKQFEPVAELANLLLSGDALNNVERDRLNNLVQHDQVESLLSDVNAGEASESVRDELLQLLLDHHGTGRILFRNSRHTVSGFPQRQCHAYPLQGTARPDNLSQDPYAMWLVGKLSELEDKRVLLICQHADTVIQLEQHLKNRHGILAAMFHEGMSVVERDRAAAYFADQESSARALFCSEIGSEGRNFQFLHHLILYDLPDNPDLLQQRIGRLDRIGQNEAIQIHIPYLENTRQHRLYRWYQEGLDAFRHNCAAAAQVVKLLGDQLDAALNQQNPQLTDALIDRTRSLNAEVEAAMQQGRDQLLELNSCRAEEASHLIKLLTILERDGSLWPYMESVFDCYGVDVEFHSVNCFILRPSESLRIAHFPFLQDDGLTVTLDRSIALAREDMQFLTNEHPMVVAAMDLVLSSETGNATVSVIHHPQLKAARFLLETLFVIECSAPAALQISRFLPATPIRILIDQTQQDLTESISHENLIETGARFDEAQISHFLNKQRQAILAIIKIAERRAIAQMERVVADADRAMRDTLSAEINRLVRLQRINSSVRYEEIEHLKCLMNESRDTIRMAQLKLDAVRFIITA